MAEIHRKRYLSFMDAIHKIMKLIPGILTIILSLVIGTYATDIFMAFAHTDYTFDLACTESIAMAVPANLKAEYLNDCEKITANIANGYKVAFGNSFKIGLSALLLFVLGCCQIIYQRANFKA